MKWKHFIDLLRPLGYDGDDGDYQAVIKWLKENKHDHENVSLDGGETQLSIKDLYEQRPGKMIDASAAAKQAARDDEIEAEVARQMDVLERATGTGKHAPTDKKDAKAHKHDVTVGLDRIEEDTTLGYGPFKELGLGLFLLDVHKAHVAIKEGRIGDVPVRLSKSQVIMHKSRLAIAKATGMSETIDSDGGFLLPTEHRSELLKKIHDTGRVFGLARAVPMTTRALELPYIVESSRADGSRHGGVRGYWGAEGGTLTKSAPKFGKLTLVAHKLHALGYVTTELEEDSAPAALAMLGELFIEELAFKMDDAFINGTGAGQPRGILNAPATISISATRAAGELDAIDVITMWTRMWARSRTNAVWFINQDVELELAQLMISGSKSDLFLYQPAGGLSGRPFGTLYGRPVIPIEQCATLGTVGDIILADMSQYLHGQRRGPVSSQSIHVQFTTDETAFKVTMRADGQPWWQAALTPFKGSNDQSPFITVASG